MPELKPEVAELPATATTTPATSPRSPTRPPAADRRHPVLPLRPPAPAHRGLDPGRRRLRRRPRPSPALGGPAPYWHTYTYDTTGNRLTEIQHAAAGDTTRTYTYPPPAARPAQPHAVTQVTSDRRRPAGRRSYGYDDAGNTSRPGRADRAAAGPDPDLGPRGPPRHASPTATGTTSYLYDADGNRLHPHATRPAPTLYLPGGTELRTPTGRRPRPAPATTPTAARPSPCAPRAGLTWIVGDHHGTGRTRHRRTDLTVTRRRTLPFGDTARHRRRPPGPATRASSAAPHDPTGLTHLGAREYDPALGRFISVDPIMDLDRPAADARLRLRQQRPATFTDPDGLFWGELGRGIAKGATNFVKGTVDSVVQPVKHGWEEYQQVSAEHGFVAGAFAASGRVSAEVTIGTVGMVVSAPVKQAEFYDAAMSGDVEKAAEIGTEQTLVAASMLAPVKFPFGRGAPYAGRHRVPYDAKHSWSNLKYEGRHRPAGLWDRTLDEWDRYGNPADKAGSSAYPGAGSRRQLDRPATRREIMGKWWAGPAYQIAVALWRFVKDFWELNKATQADVPQRAEIKANRADGQAKRAEIQEARSLRMTLRLWLREDRPVGGLCARVRPARRCPDTGCGRRRTIDLVGKRDPRPDRRPAGAERRVRGVGDHADALGGRGPGGSASVVATPVSRRRPRAVRTVDASATSGVSVRSQTLAVMPGETLTARAWAQRVAGLSGTLYLEYWRADGSRIDAAVRSADIAGVTGWQQVAVARIAPEEATTATILLYGKLAAQGTTVWDDVSVGSEPPGSRQVPNSGFEELRDAPAPSQWTVTGIAAGTASLVTSPVYSGRRACGQSMDSGSAGVAVLSRRTCRCFRARRCGRPSRLRLSAATRAPVPGVPAGRRLQPGLVQAVTRPWPPSPAGSRRGGDGRSGRRRTATLRIYSSITAVGTTPGTMSGCGPACDRRTPRRWAPAACSSSATSGWSPPPVSPGLCIRVPRPATRPSPATTRRRHGRRVVGREPAASPGPSCLGPAAGTGCGTRPPSNRLRLLHRIRREHRRHRLEPLDADGSGLCPRPGGVVENPRFNPRDPASSRYFTLYTTDPVLRDVVENGRAWAPMNAGNPIIYGLGRRSTSPTIPAATCSSP